MGEDNVNHIMLRQLIKEYPWVKKELETNPDFMDMILFLTGLVYKNAMADMEHYLVNMFGMKSNENR